MKYIFKSLLLIGFLSISVFSQPLQINNFDEMMSALENGQNVKVVIHYAKTKLIMDGEEAPAPDAIGGMDITTFEYFAKGSVHNEKAYLSTSQTVLINHPYYGYVNNYVKIRIYEDNLVEITAQYLDPKTFEVKMDEKFITKIKDSSNDEGFYLFAD